MQSPEELRRKQAKAHRKAIRTEEDNDLFSLQAIPGKLITPFGIISFKAYERFL
jgi:hypothetical protein